MRCPAHEIVMLPPTGCLDCIKWTYGAESPEYTAALATHLREKGVIG